MQMVVPDFWKGRGMYSKQAISRKIKDDAPFHPTDSKTESQSEN